MGAWRIAEEVGRESREPGEVGIPPSSAPDTRRKVRSRIQVAAAAATLLFMMVFIVASGMPFGRSPRRFPGEQFVIPPLEHLIWWDSFSEIEQTKGILRGLCLQTIAEIRRSYLLSQSEQVLAPDAVSLVPSQDSGVSNALNHLKRRLEEFQGTEHVSIFQGEILRLLRKAGRHQEWLNLYLELVYQQPGDLLIIMESARAADAAKSVGREAELHEALDHWNQIPRKYRLDTAGSEPPPRERSAP